MRRKGRLVAGALAAAACLAACGSNPPKTGTVIGKQYTPAHIVSRLIPMNTGKTVILVPQTGYAPDEWDVEIRGDCKPTDKGTEECRTGWLQVDETTYHGYAIGAQFP